MRSSTKILFLCMMFLHVMPIYTSDSDMSDSELCVTDSDNDGGKVEYLKQCIDDLNDRITCQREFLAAQAVAIANNDDATQAVKRSLHYHSNSIKEHEKKLGDYARVSGNNQLAIKNITIGLNDHTEYLNRRRTIIFLQQAAAYLLSSEVGIFKKMLCLSARVLPPRIRQSKIAQQCKNVPAYIDLITTSGIIAGASLQKGFDKDKALFRVTRGACIIGAATLASIILPERYSTNWSDSQKAFIYAFAQVGV